MEIGFMNIDEIDAEAAEVSKRLQGLASKANGLVQQITNSEQAIAGYEQTYTQACLDLAAGKNVDPGISIAAKDRETHKLLGLRALLGANKAETTPLGERNVELLKSIQQRRDREEESVLHATHENRKRATRFAVDALEAAKREELSAYTALNKHQQRGTRSHTYRQ